MRGDGRRPLIAGNWKMHTTVAQGLALLGEMQPALERVSEADVVICPPFTHLAPFRTALGGSPLRLGAQDLYWEREGAFTGEVSAAMVRELADAVIIGHSERRRLFCESDEGVRRKLEAALAVGLQPVLCVGETAEERDGGATAGVLARQVRAALDDLAPQASLAIAYEPVWAIGTGRAASGELAQEAAALVRQTVREVWGEAARALRVLYGGSVGDRNITAFLTQPDIDGALVGGASLQPAAFVGIARAAESAAR